MFLNSEFSILNFLHMSDAGEDDFYMEGPYMVFTESFLRRRGYCCESGCRHCPWGYQTDRRSEPHTDDADPAG